MRMLGYLNLFLILIISRGAFSSDLIGNSKIVISFQQLYANSRLNSLIEEPLSVQGGKIASRQFSSDRIFEKINLFLSPDGKALVESNREVWLIDLGNNGILTTSVIDNNSPVIINGLSNNIWFSRGFLT
jgi:hypothetical protein